MKKLEWSMRLNLGVQQLDDQHRRLVHLANNLVAAVQTGVAEDILGIIFEELRDYTIYHFRDEEMYMEEIGYPDRSNHAREHVRLTEQVDDYRKQLSDNKDITPSEVLEFLRGWLVNHIIYRDTQIAKFVKKNG